MSPEKDYIGQYMMTKRPNMATNIALAISFITVYVRNHEIYHKYDPKFHDGVLLIGIVGFKKDHEEFLKTSNLGISKFGCKLERIAELEEK